MILPILLLVIAIGSYTSPESKAIDSSKDNVMSIDEAIKEIKKDEKSI